MHYLGTQKLYRDIKKVQLAPGASTLEIWQLDEMCLQIESYLNLTRLGQYLQVIVICFCLVFVIVGSC